MKRTLSVLLSFFMIFNFCLSSLAIDTVITTHTIGVLKDESGQSIPVEGKLIKQQLTATPTELGFLDFSTANTYECKIFVPESSRGIDGSTYRPLEANDITYSVTAYLTVYYSYRNMNPTQGNTSYLLTRVTGHYTQGSDPAIEVTSSQLEYGCTDGDFIEQYVPYHEVSNPFDINTGFTTYCEMYLGAAGVIGASYKLNIERNTSAWTFILDNKYPL